MPVRPQPIAAMFLTTRQAATRLGVTVNAVKTWIREDQLPALRTPGGHHRIPEAELRRFETRLAVNSRRVGRTAPRVLLVDDDPFSLATLKDVVEQAVPDAFVDIATDGYEALVQVGIFRPDLLVLDLRMPRLDGFEVCRRLKARPDTQSIRILAITAYPEEARGAILACGADDFLEKPFGLPEFRDRVLALLGGGVSG
jgi:excisionase family DNA binding protein